MESNAQPIIGVLGGMGPYAGLDLVQKIFDETLAGSDQEHLPVALLSYSHRIEDRSAYILGNIAHNPAHAIADVAACLERLGVRIAGIPCNSAHAPAIYDVLCHTLRTSGRTIRLLHLIQEAVRFVREAMPHVQCIGPLSTLSVHRTGLYRDAIKAAGMDAIMPDAAVAENVHGSIFAPGTGIKAQSNPVTDEARQLVLDGVRHLRDKGAQAVILGCTELPLAVTETYWKGILLVDATRALARALIRETYPEKLAPLET